MEKKEEKKCEREKVGHGRKKRKGRKTETTKQGSYEVVKVKKGRMNQRKVERKENLKGNNKKINKKGKEE